MIKMALANLNFGQINQFWPYLLFDSTSKSFHDAKDLSHTFDFFWTTLFLPGIGLFHPRRNQTDRFPG